MKALSPGFEGLETSQVEGYSGFSLTGVTLLRVGNTVIPRLVMLLVC